MAKTRAVAKRRRSRRKMTLPLGLIAPIAVVEASALKYATDANQEPLEAVKMFGDYNILSMTGFSAIAGDFKPWRLKLGLLPVGAGIVAHWAASKFGVNRALGRAGIPLIRI